MAGWMIWSVLGMALAIGAGVIVLRLEGTSLGPFSMRLLALGAAVVGFYGMIGWPHSAGGGFYPTHLRWLHWVVPALALLAALYFIWRIAQNWRSEIHGLVKGALKLVLALLLAALARLCLSH